MKKIILVFILIELILIFFSYSNKKEVADLLKIGNTSQFAIKEMKEDIGPGSDTPIYIKFKISIDNYEKNNLKYQEETTEKGILEGEITNKRVKISDQYYMCYYETVLYGQKINQFRRIKFTRIFIRISTILLWIIVGISIYKNRKVKKENKNCFSN